MPSILKGFIDKPKGEKNTVEKKVKILLHPRKKEKERKEGINCDLNVTPWSLAFCY